MITRPDDLVCWKCGGELLDLPYPFARTAECPSCNADIRVCKLCEFYALGIAKSCREPIAEEVSNKERANFCDYFQARGNVFVPPDQTAQAKAESELGALFGAEASDASSTDSEAKQASDALNELFADKPEG